MPRTARVTGSDVCYVAITGASGEADDLVALEHECTSFGRAACANLWVTLAGPRVGRDNTRFVLANGTWYVEDAGSVNGTRVNGTLLAPKERCALLSNDVIDIGGIVDDDGELRGALRVRFRGVAPTAADPPARRLYPV